MSSHALSLDFSFFRIGSQGLNPAENGVAIANVVRRLLAIQGQQVSAIPYAILTRVPSLVRSDVGRAFNNGLLVRSWSMRGTVHVSTAEDHHWLRAVLLHRYARWYDATVKDGIDDAVCDRAVARTSFHVLRGAFDELHAGYQDWTCLTDEEGKTLIFKTEPADSVRRRALTSIAMMTKRMEKEGPWHDAQ